MEKNVCIIGSGLSGLTAIKACLERNLNPVCFEMTGDIGGMWNNTERIKLRKSPLIYQNLITNFSKLGSCYSDFPPPKEWPPFWSWKEVMEYYRMYANHFGLLSFINFNTEVVDVHSSKSYETTGSWIVKTKHLEKNTTTEQEYDAVILTGGNFAKQFCPSFPGLNDQFTGQVIHAGDYTESEIFKDKSVLVIGTGASGTDIATASASVAKNVFLSGRNGFWILPRILKNGLPFDMAITNRCKRWLLGWLPTWISDKIFTNFAKERIDHHACGIKGKYPISSAKSSTTINDDLAIRIYSGKVKTRPGIKHFTANHVNFTDGRTDKVDIVVLATGYKRKFPFLSQDIFPDDLSQVHLYKWIFPYDLKHPATLTFVGLIPVGSGSVCAISELQCRFITQVLSEKRKLPSNKAMQKAWKKSRETLLKKTGGTFKFKDSVFSYQEGIAQELDLIPSFFKLLFTDPKLAVQLYFGPIVSYHYRLIGDHTWHEARQRSLNVIEEAVSGMR